MANAARDANSVPAVIAILNTNGATITRILGNPVTRAMKVADAATGSDNGPTPARALRDENEVHTLLALSSAGNGAIVPLYADASGNLLVKST